MRDYYYAGAAKVIGTEQIVIIKTESGYLSPGNVVEFHICYDRTMAEVITTSLVSKGSKDETVINALSPAYEVEKIYTTNWEKKEEEENDGKSV